MTADIPPKGRRPAPRTRIKICGLTREADVAVAVAAGADAIGFNLYPQSPRYVEPARAALVPASTFDQASDPALRWLAIGSSVTVGFPRSTRAR